MFIYCIVLSREVDEGLHTLSRIQPTSVYFLIKDVDTQFPHEFQGRRMRKQSLLIQIPSMWNTSLSLPSPPKWMASFRMTIQMEFFREYFIVDVSDPLDIGEGGSNSFFMLYHRMIFILFIYFLHPENINGIDTMHLIFT